MVFMVEPMQANDQYKTFAEKYLDIRRYSFSELDCICIFHDDTKPSLRVNIIKGLFFCMACHASGNFYQLANQLGVQFGDGTRTDNIESVVASTVSKARKLREVELPAPEPERPSESILRRFSNPCTYWTDPPPRGRGFSPEIVTTFELGYDVLSDAVTIPLRDIEGNLLGVTKRYLARNADPKYKYPFGFTKAKRLYGEHLVAKIKPSTVVLVEGALDCIPLWNVGYPSLAIYGNILSLHHVELLKQLDVTSIILMFDNDTGGRTATDSAKGFIRQNSGTWKYKKESDLRKHFILRYVQYPDGIKDPGELDKETIDLMINNAIPYATNPWMK